MKKIKRFIYTSLPFIFLSILSLFILDVKLTFSLLFFTLLLIAYLIYKDKIGQELIIALFFGLFITSYYAYSYMTANILIGRINLFPLISWTAGLVLLREIYEKIKSKNRFLIISLFYLTTLFALEYIGFYLLNIRLSFSFPSLWGLGIIHAPNGMKLFYLLAGPTYILITDYLKVK